MSFQTEILFVPYSNDIDQDFNNFASAYTAIDKNGLDVNVVPLKNGFKFSSLTNDQELISKIHVDYVDSTWDPPAQTLAMGTFTQVVPTSWTEYYLKEREYYFSEYSILQHVYAAKLLSEETGKNIIIVNEKVIFPENNFEKLKSRFLEILIKMSVEQCQILPVKEKGDIFYRETWYLVKLHD